MSHENTFMHRTAWATRVVKPVDASSVAAFRVLFGALGVLAVVRFAALGWIEKLYLEPAYHFTYFGFEWVRPLAGWDMYVLFGVIALASLGIALGLYYRVSAVLFFLSFTYVELIDKTTYLNHYYWVSLAALLMIFLPLHRKGSLDARRNASPNHGWVAQGVVWLLRAQVGVVYVFAGIAKLNPDWLFHAMPLRIWLSQRDGLPLLGPLLGEPWVAYTMSWAGAAFDLTIVGWLLWHRSRPFAYAVLVLFHVITWVLFPIGMFPWLMIACSTVFFSPSWPTTLWARLCGMPPHMEPQPPAGKTIPLTSSRRGRLALVAVAAFALVQVVMPLRHFAYPGDVRWNEDGYRFAWRVLLTEKTGFVQFRVSDSTTGEAWRVSPEEYLTPQQVERMSTQPDMILQTAHFIARDFRSRGHVEVQVRGDAFVTFNGEPYSRFVDPDVDLASVARSIGPTRWVLPRSLGD